MSKHMYVTVKLIVVETGFCVLHGIVELKKEGAYAAALIKKCRFCSKYIKKDEVKQHMQSKTVGKVDVLRDILDDVNFHVFCMREPDYAIKIMSTYGKNEHGGEGNHYDANRNRVNTNYGDSEFGEEEDPKSIL
eukprot:8138603-Ditylum_brightwellii.AAC.1